MSGEGCKTGKVDHFSAHTMSKYVTHIVHAAEETEGPSRKYRHVPCQISLVDK